jgi:Putative zinc-finger
MNHEEAIRNQVAASYLLGDLSDTERDAFEEHYFDCRVCGDTVRAGAAMFAGGREVATNEPSFRRFRPLKWASSSAAAAALVVVATYQGAVIPRLQSLAAPPMMTVLRPTPLVTSENRGEKEEQVIRFQGEPLVLYRDMPSGVAVYPRYQTELRKADGKVLHTSDLAADLAQSGDSISMEVRPLPAGRYVLAIMGVREEGNRSEIAKWSVVVR